MYNKSMKSRVAILAVTGALVALGVGSLIVLQMRRTQPVPAVSTSGSAVTGIQSATNPPTSATTQSTQTTASYVYPLPDYDRRVVLRGFGEYVTAADKSEFPCGASFEGYHNGDDLELLDDELPKDVPVHAIAAGTVRQTGTVGGYGGLIVIEHTLAGQTVTANYGHVNIQTATVQVGDRVRAGQTIANLGEHCAASSGGERKHIHFALHKGPAVDVRGYLSTQADLANWLNPKEALKKLNASTPR